MTVISLAKERKRRNGEATNYYDGARAMQVRGRIGRVRNDWPPREDGKPPIEIKDYEGRIDAVPEHCALLVWHIIPEEELQV